MLVFDRIPELQESIDGNEAELSAVRESFSSLREEHAGRLEAQDYQQNELTSELENTKTLVTEKVDALRDDLQQEREWCENLQRAENGTDIVRRIVTLGVQNRVTDDPSLEIPCSFTVLVHPRRGEMPTSF